MQKTKLQIVFHSREYFVKDYTDNNLTIHETDKNKKMKTFFTVNRKKSW